MIQLDDYNDSTKIDGGSDTIPRGLLDQAPSIDKLRRKFDECRQDTDTNRRNNEKCRDYYDGPKQLNAEVREVLRNRAQPPIYTNRVRPAINGVLGVLEMGRRDPRGFPRNPDDEQSAATCTKTLRYINDEAKFNDVQLDVAENFFIEGTGAVIVEVKQTGSRMAIVATQIRWEEFYYDPYARRNDLKDATYMGVAKWMDADKVRLQWNVRINEIGDPFVSGNGGIWGDTWQDRPNTGLAWIDRKRNRVMVCEEYHLSAEGQWMRCVFIGNGVLEYDISPYVDEYGLPCNPIEAVSCYVDRENNRYGMVPDMIPIQDEINASRSRSLHLMNSRQVQQTNPDAPPVDSETARLEAAKADGVIPAGWAIVSTAEQTQANLLRMQEAKVEIERMGPTPAVLGRQEGASQSGRARLVSQQAGLTELARPLGRFKDWVLRCYRQLWNRARQYWDDPMWIRVTDELKAPEFLKINEPVMGQVMMPVVDPATGQQVMMPGIGVVGYKNRLAELDMDIILDQDEDTATLQQEVWAELMELLRLGMSPFSPEFELVVEMSPLADKTRILERLKAKREEMQQAQQQQMQAQQQQQERAQQIAEAGAVAEIENTQADTAKKAAEAEQTQAETLADVIDKVTGGGED